MPSCNSCGASIMWAKSEASGKAMPLNPTPTEDGNIILVDRENGGHTPIVRVLKRNDQTFQPTLGGTPTGRDGLRYTSHFATCPTAQEHRRK